MEYKLNINQYGDVVLTLENFNKQKNVYYRMHLRDGIEEIYKEQTAIHEIKVKINGLDNICKAVPFGYDGRLSNYIVK
jgi:penicillin-binding protein-related factor A (putative recombinase)